MDIIKYLKKIENSLDIAVLKYEDDFKLDIDESYSETTITYDNMYVTKEGNDLDIISIILAKSVAMERVEFEIEELIDESEIIIDIS